MAIPKKIHYCWLSDEPVSDEYNKCMDSWRPKLADYEFILWDAKRFDVSKTTWTSQAFDVGLYACAADYIRLYAVYNYGGMYLDMDMEVLKAFDDLLENKIVLAYENHISENIESGCFGAEAGHPYIRKCMEYFEGNYLFRQEQLAEIKAMPEELRHEFINPDILPVIMKNILLTYFQKEEYTIFNRYYFTAKNIINGKIEKTDETYTIHHFATTYHSKEWRQERNEIQKIHLIFGEGILGKIVRQLRAVVTRLKREGLIKGVIHYFDKYILEKEADSNKNSA